MRNIDWDAPLSEEDELWLSQRMTPELADKVAANKAKFSVEGDDDEDETEVEDDYDSWKVQELKEEAEKRNLDLTGISKKPDLIAVLRTWDAENAEA